MNYEGKMVSHNKYGVGIITRQEKDSVTISFNNTYEERTFGFPRCLENSVQILDDREILLSVLEKHGFEGFHHYTDFKNFIQIMKEKKLYSRGKAQEKGLLLTDAAENSVIAKTENFVKNMVRFYYKEDTPTLYRNEGIRHGDDFNRDEYSAHMPIPVLLLFEKELIFDPNIYISNGGCGSGHTKRTNKCEEALSYDWDEIFKRGPYGNVPYEVHKEIKNKRNAEFLFPEAISIDRLNAIVFRCEADKKHAEFILGENNLFQVNPNKFTTQMNESRKRNYLKNYCVREQGARREIELEFFNSPAGYGHKLIQYFRDGHVEEMNIDHLCSDSCFIGFAYDTEDDSDRIEYLLNNEVSAIWR